MPKPDRDGFAVVTATTSLPRSRACRWSWDQQARYGFRTYCVQNGGEFGPYLGVVPAFAEGVAKALRDGHQIIACLHDDLLIEQDGWDVQVADHFERYPRCGLLGFGGGRGLGHPDIYKVPYSPHQLARDRFVSNMRDAEAHGARVVCEVQVACLDGFSQIGRREYWQGQLSLYPGNIVTGVHAMQGYATLFHQMASWGVVHHAYDAALGAFAKRLGWEVWMLPVACHHFGGQTAVGDPGYHKWAEQLVPGGDQTFWEMAHKEVYDHFRDVLPIRVGERVGADR